MSTMEGFYTKKLKGQKQARIAIVESKSRMAIVPRLLSGLLGQYLNVLLAN